MRSQESRKRQKHFIGWILWAITTLVLVVATVVAASQINGLLLASAAPTISDEQLAQLQPNAQQESVGQPNEWVAAKQMDAGLVEQALTNARQNIPGDFAIAVADLDANGQSYSYQGDQPMTPASVMKIMTSISSLELLNPSEKFQTTTVLEETTLTLVGGGDPLLASTADSHPYRESIEPASLQDLANETAASLQKAGITRVNLVYDDSLFTGPNWHEDWPLGDRPWVAPITALTVDLGSPQGQETNMDPSFVAASIFASQLSAAGIQIDGQPTAGKASDQATELAQVQSPSVYNMIEQLLTHSDNYIAEIMMRHNAIAAGNEASFTGGIASQTAVLTQLGLVSDGQNLVDGSGLSENNRLTANNLLKALQLAKTNPKFSYLLDALPVAAATGTLLTRFNDAQSGVSQGVLRAKTGSLDGVSSLAGYTTTADGALVAFVFIGNDLPLDQDPRPWLDHLGAALSGCQCGLT